MIKELLILELTNVSKLKLLARATFETSEQKLINSLFFATKSVSELISNIQALVSLDAITAKPSAASLEDFLAALVIPFFRRYSIDFSISKLFSDRAVLQSWIPAPVNSLSSLTFARLSDIE